VNLKNESLTSLLNVSGWFLDAREYYLQCIVSFQYCHMTNDVGSSNNVSDLDSRMCPVIIASRTPIVLSVTVLKHHVALV
jgi:hypothetical protein